MSCDYSVIIGYGIELHDIKTLLDYEKINKHINKRFHCDDSDADDLVSANYILMNCGLSSGLAELMADADPHGRLRGMTPDSEKYYLIYPMSYPWTRQPTDARTEEKAVDILLRAILPIVKDNTAREQITKHFYYFNHVE